MHALDANLMALPSGDRCRRRDASRSLAGYPLCSKRGATIDGRKRGARTALAILVLALSLFGGCGTPEPAPQDRFYSLEPQLQTPPATSVPLRATLLVNDLAARGFVGGREIVYRTRERPLEVQRYHLLLWEEPPARAIAGNLATAIRAAHLFEFVVAPAQRSRTDYILGGELHRFEHLPTAERPRVAADFTLTLLSSADRRTLFSKRYQGEEPVPGNAPEALARAFIRLAGRLVGQAVQDLQVLTPRLPAARGR